MNPINKQTWDSNKWAHAQTQNIQIYCNIKRHFLRTNGSEMCKSLTKFIHDLFTVVFTIYVFCALFFFVFLIIWFFPFWYFVLTHFFVPGGWDISTICGKSNLIALNERNLPFPLSGNKKKHKSAHLHKYTFIYGIF